MKILIFIVCWVLSFEFVLAQKETNKKVRWNCRIFTEELTYACKWKVIAKSGFVSGVVVKFNKAQGRCGDEFVGSVAILAIGKDTIRTILYCYSNTLSPGNFIEVEISNPPNNNLSIPVDIPWGYVPKRGERVIYRVNEYDEIVLNTVFGNVTKVKKI